MEHRGVRGCRVAGKDGHEFAPIADLTTLKEAAE